MPIEVKLNLGRQPRTQGVIRAGEALAYDSYVPDNPEIVVVSCNKDNQGGRVYHAPLSSIVRLGNQKPTVLNELVIEAGNASGDFTDIPTNGTAEIDYYPSPQLEAGKLILRHYIAE